MSGPREGVGPGRGQLIATPRSSEPSASPRLRRLTDGQLYPRNHNRPQTLGPLLKSSVGSADWVDMTARSADSVDELVAVRKRLDRLAYGRLVGRLSNQDARQYDLLCGQERSLHGSVAG